MEGKDCRDCAECTNRGTGACPGVAIVGIALSKAAAALKVAVAVMNTEIGAMEDLRDIIDVSDIEGMADNIEAALGILDARNSRDDVN